MMDFNRLETKYKNDAAFNKMVNLFTRLISEHGFLPDEIREGLFFAQWHYQLGRAEQVIRTQEDWAQIIEARELLQKIFAAKPEGEES